jgi:hypothetical protein
MRKRLFLVVLKREKCVMGGDVIVPWHTSARCETRDAAEHHLQKFVAHEMTQHECVSFDELKRQEYRKQDYPMFMKYALEQGLSENDRLWLLADPEKVVKWNVSSRIDRFLADIDADIRAIAESQRQSLLDPRKGLGRFSTV